MAEQLQGVWKELQDNGEWEIRRAFKELDQRWTDIWAQEGLRWNAAVNHYQYAMDQEGRWHHDWVSKSPEARIAGMQQALVDMREATDTRLPWEAYAGQGSYMSGPPPEKMTHDYGFDPGTPGYVAWIVREAIRNGYEEGRPLRADEIEALRQEVWAQEIGGQHVVGQSRAETVLERSHELWYAQQEQEQAAANQAAYAHTRADLQDALRDTYALLADVHPHSAEAMDLRNEAAELREALAALPAVEVALEEHGTREAGPGDWDEESTPRIEVDTSGPASGPAWQAQLQQLEARLAALTQDEPTHDQNHEGGMSY